MKIELNIDELIQEFNLPTNTADFIVESSVDLVTQEIYRNWVLQATNGLKSTRNEYVNNLNIIENTRFSRTIMLTGKLPNMLEKGIGPYDMKESFRKSSKVKYSATKDKQGNIKLKWYLTIPFRMGTPGIVGENQAFSGIMPSTIHNIVKNMPANKGLAAKNVPSPFNIPSSRKAIELPSRTIPEYKHKSSIYQGITKKTAVYGKGTQNTYVSFRRVGENSDPNSWIHRGIQANNFMKKALSETQIDIVVENNVDQILSNLGYGK